MKPRRYNHAYSFAFSINSSHPKGDDLSGAQLRDALIKRARDIDDSEMLEACGMPFDTYEEPEPLFAFLVMYYEKGGTISQVFCCQAEDAEHALEQAKNAYPDGDFNPLRVYKQVT